MKMVKGLEGKNCEKWGDRLSLCRVLGWGQGRGHLRIPQGSKHLGLL